MLIIVGLLIVAHRWSSGLIGPSPVLIVGHPVLIVGHLVLIVGHPVLIVCHHRERAISSRILRMVQGALFDWKTHFVSVEHIKKSNKLRPEAEKPASGLRQVQENLFFKSEMSLCIDFLNGIGSYPINCIGWRPLP